MLKPGDFTKYAMQKEAILFEEVPTMFDPGAFRPSIPQQQAAEAAMRSGKWLGAAQGGLEGALFGAGMGGMPGAMAGKADLGALGLVGGGGIGGLAGALHGWDVGGAKSRNEFLAKLEQQYLAEQAARRSQAGQMHSSVDELARKLLGAGEQGAQMATDAVGKAQEGIGRMQAGAASMASQAKGRASDMLSKLPPGALQKGMAGAAGGLGALALYKLLAGGGQQA